MQIVKIEPGEAAGILASSLKEALGKHDSVTWFLPGGSNIKTSIEAMDQIPDELSERLYLSQTDERFGPLGHKDSNWQQLQDLGFKFKRAKLAMFLQDQTSSLEQVTKRAGDTIQNLILHSYTIGQFGIGPDGHIAGIKPGSPASVATGLTSGYPWEDFTRITMTFSAIRQLNQVLTFAFGEAKLKTLTALRDKSHPLINQPAAILKSASSSILYNDQIGEN
jgi:6-phosphogluconolactonase/glucosamine-6-phosphate isomerase/deaminase